MEKRKKKGSGKVLISIGAVFVALAVIITGAASYFSGVLDTYVSLGEAKTVQKPGSENWDSQYYSTDYSSAEEIDKAAKDTTKAIAGEGMTLLKNNGVLPLKTPMSVSLFGRRSVDTVWGGTGSGAGDPGQCTPIAEALTATGFKVNDTLTKLYADNLDKVEVGFNSMDKLSNMTYYIGEFPMSYYTGSVTSSYSSYHDAAIVVFGRQGGEGIDLSSNLKASISSGETAMSSSVAETANYAADLTASDEVIKNLSAYTPDYYDSADTKPTIGAFNGMKAVALRGAAYDDPRWEKLLDQLSVKDMTSFIYAGNQGTVNVSSISLPATNATDGPAGLKQYGGLGLGASGNFNCCGTLVAATWNVELAEAYGTAVGNEAVEARMDGWYAPGCDLHRTAFAGRNFEYYSEDPVVSGKTCAGTIQGATQKGLICLFKHFALNDVETHRGDNGPCVWANEQAMRELYLRVFEIAIKRPVIELNHHADRYTVCTNRHERVQTNGRLSCKI